MTTFFASEDRVHGRELWQSDGTAVGTSRVKDINAVVRFQVSSHGQPNLKKGTLRVPVTVGAAGRLVVRPAADSPLRRTVRDVASAGPITVTLRPTRAGMRTLRREGMLRVRAQFTFTPAPGSTAPSSSGTS